MASTKFPHDLIVPRIEVPKTLASLAANVTVSNTATETDLISATIPANTITLGATYRISAIGSIDHRATAENFNFNVLLGTDNLISTNAAADATARTDKEWWVEAFFKVGVVGSSGAYRGGMSVSHNINVGTSTCTVLTNVATANQTVDTTIDNAIKLTITMVQNASNITRAIAGSIKQIS